MLLRAQISSPPLSNRQRHHSYHFQRTQDHQFNTFTSVLLSYKSIIYKSSSLLYFPITLEHPTSQQHCKVYQYSEYFICKDAISTVPNKFYINE